MVAKIITGKSISGALNYNEHKVACGKADLLMAWLYPKDIEHLNFYDKLGMLQSRASLNHRSKTNCIHISLNFDPSEHLSQQQLTGIAQAYMDKIGFGLQPFLVYQHHDAAHDHVHIVSTNIRRDGSRIELHNIGRTLSETARKEIEKEFNLVPAESRNRQSLNTSIPVLLEKATYGKSETKRAITNIVREVIRNYKFTSLTEFNAVLRQFNIIANQGKEGTKMRQHGGLHYSMVDANGELAGVPVKASSIYGSPTLKSLQQEFGKNEIERREFKSALRESIAAVLQQSKGAGREKFIQGLKALGIRAVFHENAEGFVYGLTYVDNVNRCVFKGSDLGKEYSAKSINEHIGTTKDLSVGHSAAQDVSFGTKAEQEQKKAHDPLSSRPHEPEGNSSYLPYELSRNKKKRKKKRRT